MALLQRAKESGICPPSLITEDKVANGDGFEETVLRVLEITGLSLAEGALMEDWQAIMKMTEELNDGTPYRRCIILAIVGSTSVENAMLKKVLECGYLVHVKTWYDQILNGIVGNVDLLLHLLSNVKDLPVTTSVVKASKLGPAIGKLGKHSICKGTPNESAILERVSGIKDAWKASVKARKEQDTNADAPIAKRQLDASASASPAKKQRVEEKKSNSFSSLLKKVSSSATSAKTPTPNGTVKATSSEDKLKKNASMRVKWADHFGGNLKNERILESADTPAAKVGKSVDSDVSWQDRKKRDRLKEKELLAKAKKSKLMDDDDDDVEPAPRMATTKPWRKPDPLVPNPEVTAPILSSAEIAVQNERTGKVQPAKYVTDDSVPDSPAPLTGVEQALDMTSVASANVANIPFFIPQAPAPPPQAPSPAQATTYQPPVSSNPPLPTYTLPPQGSHESATVQTVQSLGLPLFLVGQNVGALQTLASSPSLLNTLVEPNGQYDQPRLLSLVHTLSQSTAPSHHAPVPMHAPPAFGGASYLPPGAAGGGIYGPASVPESFGGFSGTGGGPKSGGYRGESNSDGNLHVSGYGPTTTQADIISMFSPYVRVDEVVMKGTFCFVNTSDPGNAQKAREILSGTLLGGMPIRINMAQRRARDPNFAGGAGGPPKAPTLPPPRIAGSFGAPPVAGGFGAPPGGQNVDDVRDDRGNPATKNLFVAGYGPGTSEAQIKEMFGQYATIVGIVMKGTFAFVNTSDKVAAVNAREFLSNTTVNGGALRINFAKESGRLGTSFDVTYNNGIRGGGGGGRGGPGHYGRF